MSEKNYASSNNHSNSSAGLLDVMEESRYGEREPDSVARSKLTFFDNRELHATPFLQQSDAPKKKILQSVTNESGIPILPMGSQPALAD